MDWGELYDYCVDFIDQMSHQFLTPVLDLFNRYGYFGFIILLIGGIAIIVFFL